MKHSNWILVIGVVIALLLLGSLSYSTMKNSTPNNNSSQETTITKAKKNIKNVAIKPIWQFSKSILRIDQL